MLDIYKAMVIYYFGYLKVLKKSLNIKQIFDGFNEIL